MATVVVISMDGTEVIVGRVAAGAPDLALVDALTRLQLDACRCGRRLRLRGVAAELGGLLELVGLAGVLLAEPRRQPERVEQLGEDEVVQADDPLA